jgi:ABC-type phosphate transport system permease subunit
VSRTNIIYIAVGACAVVGLGVWVSMILVPAWTAYTRLWQRVVAGLLSLYVAAVMASAGIALGVLLVPWVWDRIHS